MAIFNIINTEINNYDTFDAAVIEKIMAVQDRVGHENQNLPADKKKRRRSPC